MTVPIRDRLIARARRRRGIPYRLPPDGINTLDCSLFVLVTYRDAGVPLPAGVRTAEQIRQACTPIEWADVRPADLLFFEHTYEPDGPRGPDGRIASHVGISLGAGSGRMWDCHSSNGDSGLPGVTETDVTASYWQSRLFEVRRVPALVGADDAGPPIAAPTGPRYRVNADNVRVRAEPSLIGAILDELPAGTRVIAAEGETVERDGHEWRRVALADGRTGWMASRFLREVDAGPASDGSGLSGEDDRRFTFDELRPHIEAAAATHGADARVIAAILCQESGFKNWRVHHDGTGHGLIGLDDNGLLPDFERWSGLSCGRGHAATTIPPGPQIEYCARIIAGTTERYGGAYNAARVWHRGPGLWKDARGDAYERLIRGHVARLYG